MMVAKLSLLTLALVAHQALASPLPSPDVASETIDGATSASQLAFELIEQISGVFNKTGTLVKKIAEISDYDEIHEHGDMIGRLGEELDDKTADAVSTGFQQFVDYLPALKHNISEALKKVPALRSKIAEQVDNIPAKDTIKDKVNSFLDNLPEFEGANEVVETVRENLHNHIDTIPSKTEIHQMINSTVDSIPSNDYIQTKIDEFVEKADSVVDELNETE